MAAMFMATLSGCWASKGAAANIGKKNKKILFIGFMQYGLCNRLYTIKNRRCNFKRHHVLLCQYTQATAIAYKA